MKTLRSIGNLLVYFLIIGGVLFGLPKLLSWGLDTPYPMAAITSGSMWPVLNKDDLVVVQGIERSQLSVGDIVVFRNPAGSGFTIHRVVKLGEDTFTTKGDANFSEDPAVPYDAVIGRALAVRGRYVHIPYLGAITMLASGFRK